MAELLPAGTRLDEYRILAPLGRGGMGTVYKARDDSLGREAAIKIVSPEFMSDPRRVERFTREARAAARVAHPNIVTVYRVSEVRGLPYIVLELMTGGTLHDRLRATGTIPWREALGLMAPIARALGAIHRAGLVHRDLKPGNILL